MNQTLSAWNALYPLAPEKMLKYTPECHLLQEDFLSFTTLVNITLYSQHLLGECVLNQVGLGIH